MIPDIDQPLTLKKKKAQVISGGLPTEKHGEERVSYLDLRLVMLLEFAEFDQMVDPKTDLIRKPSDLLYDQDSKMPHLDGFEIEASLRSKIEGQLTINEMLFQDAHLVGNANKLEVLSTGPQLSMTVRIDPNAKQLQLCRHLLGKTCVIDFEEKLDENPKPPENQESLPV